LRPKLCSSARARSVARVAVRRPSGQFSTNAAPLQRRRGAGGPFTRSGKVRHMHVMKSQLRKRNRNCDIALPATGTICIPLASQHHKGTTPMSNKMEWNPQAAESREELQDVLLFAASGLKTQVLASRLLGEDD